MHQLLAKKFNSISGCTAGRGMGRLSVGVAPCSRRPLDAGRCCGLRGCDFRPPSVRPNLAFKMSHKLFILCAWDQVPPSMVPLGRARALRVCGATTHPCMWVAWCMQALELCPVAASLRAVGGVLARYQAREQNSTHMTVLVVPGVCVCSPESL